MAEHKTGFTPEQLRNMPMDEFRKLRAGLLLDYDCPSTEHGVHLIMTEVNQQARVRSYCTACGFEAYKEQF